MGPAQAAEARGAFEEAGGAPGPAEEFLKPAGGEPAQGEVSGEARGGIQARASPAPAQQKSLFGQKTVEVHNAIRGAPHAVVRDHEAESVFPVGGAQFSTRPVEGRVDVADGALAFVVGEGVSAWAFGVVVPPVVVAHGIAFGKDHGH